MIRTHSRYVIIGAGIHGLSTAWHPARDCEPAGSAAARNIRAVAAWRRRRKPKACRSRPHRVTGFGISGNAVTSVETDQGAIACDQLVIAAGLVIRDLWAWLDLPHTITVAQPGGTGGVARARQLAINSERHNVAAEVRDLVGRSGLSRQDFADRIGTSRSRLSTYMSGRSCLRQP